MKNVTIEIAIPALNEAANLKNLLASIKSQKTSSYKIAKVTVISDGSKDNTVKIAQEFKGLPMAVIDHRSRKGKTTRMNELFSSSECDILVLFDADVVLDSKETIAELIQPIISARANLAGGRPIKIHTGTFFDKVMDVSMYLQDEVKFHFRNGDSLYSCHGRVVALKSELFKNIDLPMPSTANDAYLYLFNKRNGGKFVFVPKAKVLYKAAQSLADFIKQQRRFSNAPQEQAKLFGKSVYSEYKIPKSLQLTTLIRALLKFHIYFLSYIGVRIISSSKPKTSAGKWDVSESTKSI